jgi:hypothetical protein
MDYAKAIAQGIKSRRYQKLLDEGRYASISEMAAAKKIERGYLCSLLRLTLLAPELVEGDPERVTAGRGDAAAAAGGGAGGLGTSAGTSFVWRADQTDRAEGPDRNVTSNPIASAASAWRCGRQP